MSLVLIGRFIPESAKSVLARGRVHEAEAEAEAVMRLFGSRRKKASPQRVLVASSGYGALTRVRLVGKIAALRCCGLARGLVNFGRLLWLPADLVAKDYSVGLSSRLLAGSALSACPTVFLAALLYSKWSSKWSLIAMVAIT